MAWSLTGRWTKFVVPCRCRLFSAIPDWDPLGAPRPRPSSPSYYTGKPAYNDTLIRLEQAVRQATHRVKGIGKSDVVVEQQRYVWRTPSQMTDLLGYQLRSSEHRKIVAHLAQLAKLQPRLEVALQTSKPDVEGAIAQPLQIAELLNEFKRPDSASVLTSTKLRPLDNYGRSNALGRRKEASAKVFMIKSDQGVGRILVNGKGLADYFPRNVDRQQVYWPLLVANSVKASLKEQDSRVSSAPQVEPSTDGPSTDESKVIAIRPPTQNLPDASLPSSFNIFAIVQGGGRSGQAGAIAHGISRALIQHATDIKEKSAGDDRNLIALKAALNKVKVLKRDPRMVERKKTGQPKARARYTWVKR